MRWALLESPVSRWGNRAPRGQETCLKPPVNEWRSGCLGLKTTLLSRGSPGVTTAPTGVSRVSHPCQPSFNVHHHVRFLLSCVSIEGFTHQSMATYFLPEDLIIDPIMGLLQMEINVIWPSIYFCFPHWNGYYGYIRHTRIVIMLFLN